MTDRSRRWLRILLAVLAGIVLVAAGAIAWRVHRVEQIRAQLERDGIHAVRIHNRSSLGDVPVIGQALYSLRGATMVECRAYAAGVPAAMSDADWIRNLPLLKELPPVAVISLQGTDLSGQSLASFAEFPALESVRLTRCRIGDADIPALARCSNLRTLQLEDTAVTGTGLRSLAGLETLRSLSLDGSPISEEGIGAISQFRHLRSISMSNVGLAESEIERLQQALPGVMISDD